MKAAVRAALVVAMVLLVAGCTSIPTTGSVQEGRAQQANEPGFEFVPNPPADGADPQAIVTGFVAAATEGAPYDVAKQFLTAAGAKAWKPNEEVLVHDDSWTTTATGTDSVDLDVQVSARVDADGSYEELSRERHLSFELQRVGGQWRISSAPNGVLLATNVFQSVFTTERLQFFDPTWSRFVPDLRWFPNRADPSTEVVRALLAGPSAPIGSGVTATAFPTGTTLGGVSTSGGTTSVRLTAPGDPDAKTLVRMQQQLSSSLGLDTSQLRLTVNGRVATPAPQPTANPVVLRPFAVVDGRFGSLTDPQGTLQPDATLGTRIAAADPTAVTFSSRQQLAAVQVGSGPSKDQVAIVTPDRTTVVDDRALLTAPTMDQMGWVYSVPTDDPEGLQASNAKGDAVSMTSRIDGASISRIEVSPDGTRMLVVVNDDGFRAYVAGIQRAADGTPIGLTSAEYPVAVPGALALSATWVTGTNGGEVAVLTSDSDAQIQTVTQQQLSGFSQTLDRLSGARQIVGTDSDLRALLQNGDIAINDPTAGWESEFARPTKVSVLAVQR